MHLKMKENEEMTTLGLSYDIVLLFFIAPTLKSLEQRLFVRHKRFLCPFQNMKICLTRFPLGPSGPASPFCP